ncbi:MAG: alpha-amylase family glycosyl hydrolase [Anaerolineae bacterium]|nr:alpha-amylase family glycosyl hydrolase [Anaerolineae bacterium]
MTSPETPNWVRDAIFYQILPDRFARSERVVKPSNLEPWESAPTVHGFKGGDLLGVAEHLDYLQDLGITAIYFNPIFQSAANHRYHTHDYYRVDPILGGDDALRTLLDQAHQRGIYVILDGVFNHASRGFFQFHHIVENGPASPYVDWFLVKKFPLRPYHAPRGQHGYESWWDLPALPKLNVDSKAVRNFLWDVACHWIEFGIDGWRLDVPGDIDDDEFWEEFRDRVKTINPEAYIVGEIWGDARRWLQGDQFDAVMNYLFTRACLGFFVGDNLLQAEIARTGYHQIDVLDAEEFADDIDELLELYPQTITEVQYNLLGSHDTPRFKTLARGDDSAYRLATLFQMTYPGAPSIYYGDEIAMEGRHDPDCRRSFPWDERQWDHEMRGYIQRCIRLRQARPELRNGEFDWLFAGQGVVAYLRKGQEGSVVVALNNTRQPVTIDLPVSEHLEDGTELRDPWEEQVFTVARGQLAGIRLPARSGVALASTGE